MDLSFSWRPSSTLSPLSPFHAAPITAVKQAHVSPHSHKSPLTARIASISSREDLHFFHSTTKPAVSSLTTLRFQIEFSLLNLRRRPPPHPPLVQGRCKEFNSEDEWGGGVSELFEFGGGVKLHCTLFCTCTMVHMDLYINHKVWGYGKKAMGIKVMRIKVMRSKSRER